MGDTKSCRPSSKSVVNTRIPVQVVKYPSLFSIFLFAYFLFEFSADTIIPCLAGWPLLRKHESPPLPPIQLLGNFNIGTEAASTSCLSSSSDMSFRIGGEVMIDAFQSARSKLVRKFDFKNWRISASFLEHLATNTFCNSSRFTWMFSSDSADTRTLSEWQK